MKACRLVLGSFAAALWLPSDARASEVAPPLAPAPAPVVAPAGSPAQPLSAPPQRSAAELEKLVAPIALYPDPLLATILPASVYPLEIVQAARFVKDTNNLSQLDNQPWDDSVKAVARVPAVIDQLNRELQRTIDLGEAFLAQDKEVMAAIQTLRAKAQKAGTLQSTPQQVIVVTNVIVEKTIEQQVVVVTNTIVQIQPSDPQVVYVPTYNPAVVYAPPPAYVYNPYAPLVTFGVGIAVGAVIANNCDWHGGGVYVGHHGVTVWGGGGHHGDVDVNVNRNVNVNNNPRASPVSTSGGQQKWQPDQNRLRNSGSSGTGASAGTAEARGWSSGSAPRASQTAAPRASSASTSQGSAGTRPSSRPAAAQTQTRPAPQANAPSPRSTSTGTRSASQDSAFSGVSSGAGARSSSSRGTASRSGGGRGGGRR